MDETNVLSEELRQSIESGINLPQPYDLRSSINDIPDSWGSIDFNGTTNPYDMSEEDAALRKLSKFSVYNVTKHILSSTYEGVKNMVMAPGKAMQEGTTTEQAIPWATNTALATMGTGTNFNLKAPRAIAYEDTAVIFKEFENPYDLMGIGNQLDELLSAKPLPEPKKELRLTKEVNVFKYHLHPRDPNFYWDIETLQYLPVDKSLEGQVSSLLGTKQTPSKEITISREGDFFYAEHPDHTSQYIGNVHEVSPGVYQAEVVDTGVGKFTSKEKAYEAIKHEIGTSVAKGKIKTPDELKNYYTNVEFVDEPKFYPASETYEAKLKAAKMQAQTDATLAKWEEEIGDIKFEQVPYTPKEYKPAPTPDPNFSEWDSHIFDLNRKYIDALPEPRGLSTDLPLQQPERVQRAKELGFNLDPSKTEIGGDWYHGTKKIFEEFNIGKAKSEDAVFLSNNPDIAKIYGNHIIPVWTRAKNVEVIDFKGSPYNPDKFQKIIEKANSQGKDAVLFKNVIDMGGRQDQLAILKENMIRSKFAIFDKGAKELANLTATGVGGAVILRRFLNESEDQR